MSGWGFRKKTGTGARNARRGSPGYRFDESVCCSEATGGELIEQFSGDVRRGFCGRLPVKARESDWPCAGRNSPIAALSTPRCRRTRDNCKRQAYSHR